MRWVRSRVHGVCGFWSPLAVGLFAAGYPTGLNNVDSSLTGQLYGMMIFLPLGFFGGYIPSWILKKFNLLRVPPEVELEGLDMAEFNADFYPEFDRPAEVIIEPDGTQVPSAPILLEDYANVIQNGNGRAPRTLGARLTRDELVFSILLMIAVVGSLGGWAYRKDRRMRRAGEN